MKFVTLYENKDGLSVHFDMGLEFSEKTINEVIEIFQTAGWELVNKANVKTNAGEKTYATLGIEKINPPQMAKVIAEI